MDIAHTKGQVQDMCKHVCRYMHMWVLNKKLLPWSVSPPALGEYFGDCEWSRAIEGFSPFAVNIANWFTHPGKNYQIRKIPTPNLHCNHHSWILLKIWASKVIHTHPIQQLPDLEFSHTLTVMRMRTSQLNSPQNSGQNEHHMSQLGNDKCGNVSDAPGT